MYSRDYQDSNISVTLDFKTNIVVIDVLIVEDINILLKVLVWYLNNYLFIPNICGTINKSSQELDNNELFT